VLLVETARKAGLDQAISAALTPWRKRRAVHDPGKILLDVSLAGLKRLQCRPDTLDGLAPARLSTIQVSSVFCPGRAGPGSGACGGPAFPIKIALTHG
jgi:hypothetical protein